MFSTPAAPVRANAFALSNPGTWTIIALPGLKPSLRLYWATPIRCPLVFTGIAPAGSRSRSPVGVDRSVLVKRLLGNGSRQGVPLNGWQSTAVRVVPAPAEEESSVARTAQRPSPRAASAQRPGERRQIRRDPRIRSFNLTLSSRRRDRASTLPHCVPAGDTTGRPRLSRRDRHDRVHGQIPRLTTPCTSVGTWQPRVRQSAPD